MASTLQGDFGFETLANVCSSRTTKDELAEIVRQRPRTLRKSKIASQNVKFNMRVQKHYDSGLYYVLYDYIQNASVLVFDNFI